MVFLWCVNIRRLIDTTAFTSRVLDNAPRCMPLWAAPILWFSQKKNLILDL